MSLTIETSQNVYLEYEPAPIGARIGAQMLDTLFQFVYIIVMFIIIISFKMFSSNYVVLLMIIPIYFYSLLFETFMQGQTPGKYIVKIKVVQIDGQEPSFWNYFLRWLGCIVDFSLSSGLVAIITIAVNKKGQRLGDLMAGTSVVFVDKKDSLERTGYIEVPADYQASFNEALLLTDKDVRIIAAIVSKLRKDNSLNTYHLASKAKAKLEEKIHQGQTIDMAADVYMETLLKDYNYLNTYQSL